MINTSSEFRRNLTGVFMFGIGFLELCVIAVVALVFVGPARLPDMMKQVGKFFVHARRMSSEVRSTFDNVVREAESEMRQDELAKVRAVLQAQREEIVKEIDGTTELKPASPESTSPDHAVALERNPLTTPDAVVEPVTDAKLESGMPPEKNEKKDIT